MAKILYTINGDGMGHSTRSAAIISELRKHHTVKIIAGSVRTYNYLSKMFPDVHNFEGIKAVYKNNKVSDYATVRDFFKSIIVDGPETVQKIYRIIKTFKPDVVITDFEGATAYIANILNIPVLCVCNVHSVTKLRYDVPKKYKKAYHKAKIVINTVYPKADYHLITTFFYPPTKGRRVMLFPPILRKEILSLKPQRKGYIMVYQTSKTNKKLINALENIKYKFVVYGFDKEEKHKNLQFRKFNEKQFFKDIGDCNACITNGGFSFLSEAVWLHKPIFCIPISGQFEQIINGLFIKKLKYGELHDSANKKDVENFIKMTDKYYNNLKHFKKEDNSKILRRIDDIINIETGHDNHQ